MTIGRQRFISGGLYEIPLKPFMDSFALAKFMDYRKVNPDISCPAVLLVYNVTSKNGFKENIDTTSLELLCNPLRFFGGLMAPLGWRRFAKVSVSSSEYRSINLRHHWPLLVESRSDLRQAKWFLVNDGDVTSMKHKVDYDSVRHLETTWETYIDRIPLRIYIELCKFNEVDIGFFERSEDYRNIYLGCFDIPKYRDIPEVFRNKICPEGISTYVGEKKY